MNKGKHLTFDNRCTIVNSLNEHDSFKTIGNKLGKDCTTISKEVKKHITILQIGCTGRVYNNCIHHSHCHKGELCGTCTYLRMINRCRSCSQRPTGSRQMYMQAYPLDLLPT